jgi:hypothetical protein
VAAISVDLSLSYRARSQLRVTLPHPDFVSLACRSSSTGSSLSGWWSAATSGTLLIVELIYVASPPAALKVTVAD